MKWNPFRSEKSTLLGNGEPIFIQAGTGMSFSPGTIGNLDRIKAYTEIPEVNAILNLRAKCMSNMRIIAVDDTGKEITVTDDLIELLKKPNYFQSKEELFAQTSIFRDVFGNEYMYFQKPLGIKKFTGIFTLPSQGVTIKDVGGAVTTEMPFYLRKSFPGSLVYTYLDYSGIESVVPKESLLHLTDNSIKNNTALDFYTGASRLDPLKMPIANIRAAYEARNVLIENRGAIGILSNASKDGIGGVAPMNKTERDKLQERFAGYGITRGKSPVIITNLALSWSQMAVDVKKLQLFEECHEDTIKVCDAYGVQIEMLSTIRNTTFNNRAAAQAQFYRDTIIPDANIRVSGINAKFNIQERGYTLIASFNHLPIFETERKERAATLTLTVNALSKALADGAIDLPLYKQELSKLGVK